MTKNSAGEQVRRIGPLIRSFREYVSANPHKAVQPDSEAVATMGPDMRCTIDGAGVAVTTDMASGLGGRGVFPSPGWYLRAGVASCAATSIAMRAAELGLELSHLGVRATSVSDSRGLMGLDDAHPGPEEMSLRVEIGAPGVADEVLHELAAYADTHAPVSDAVRREVPLSVSVVIMTD